MVNSRASGHPNTEVWTTVFLSFKTKYLVGYVFERPGQNTLGYCSSWEQLALPTFHVFGSCHPHTKPMEYLYKCNILGRAKQRQDLRIISLFTFFWNDKHSCCILVSSFTVCVVVFAPLVILILTGQRIIHLNQNIEKIQENVKIRSVTHDLEQCTRKFIIKHENWE